jgi:hypothetical protein
MAAMGITVIRPSRKGEPDPGIFANWLRQRIESVNWTLKGQLGLDQHGGRVISGLWARVLQRLLDLNVAIWHNWACGAKRKRSLIHYDHPQPPDQHVKAHQPSSRPRRRGGRGLLDGAVP